MTEKKVQLLIEEMRANGNLPAISENVRDICNISRQSNSCAVDLAAIIMRDCGLTSTILATANSTLYSPRFPIKTVSYAVTFLGFEKVCSLALGLSLFKQTMESAHNQKLVHLYASSYFSGTFAMGLAREFKYKNPEEIFVSGLLYRLPWIALANTFPKRFQNMESLIHKGNLSYNEACLKVFDVEYTDICSGLVKVYNLPSNVADVLMNKNGDDGMINSLVHQAGHIANMLFGDRLGGKEAIADVNNTVRALLHNDSFSASDFIKEACKKDHNISRFFKLDKGDIDMMVNALEWGKGNPAQITSQSNFGQTCDEAVRSQEDPEQIIGHFLTELMLWHKRDIDVNQMLMLAQEAIFRCMSSPEVFTAFLSNDKSRLTGRFYAGNRADIKAEEFTIGLHEADSPVIAALTAGRSGRWFIGEEALHLPGLKKHMNIKSALFSPITAANQTIGMYFVARTANDLFTEKEQAWLEQIADYLGKSFENMRKRHASSEYMPDVKEQATESSAPPETLSL